MPVPCIQTIRRGADLVAPTEAGIAPPFNELVQLSGRLRQALSEH